MVLAVQELYLEWYKECRGYPFTQERSQMEYAYLLPADFFDTVCCKIPFHVICSQQKPEGISIIRQGTAHMESFKKNSGIEVVFEKDSASVFFQYEYRMGEPVRDFRYHKRKIESDTPDYLCKRLREKAFHLYVKDGDYGRLCYNGRHRDFDTGQWYYELHVLNFILMDKQEKNFHLFTEREPDVVYEQLAHLY